MQRTCSRRRCSAVRALGNFIFWGYQPVHRGSAAFGYVLGITQGKEYAEPEWWLDLWLTVVWVAYLVAFVRYAVQA